MLERVQQNNAKVLGLETENKDLKTALEGSKKKTKEQEEMVRGLGAELESVKA